MPRNRQHIDRETRVAGILDAAEELLLRDGYEPTTMAAVARAAGVATNSIYWYFPGKDDLLAAVLQRRLDRASTRLDTDSEEPLPLRAVSALAELDAVSKLTSAVHERAKHSTAVATMHAAFHDVLSARVAEGFTSTGMTEADAKKAAAAIVAVIEGIHLHEPARDPDARNDLVQWLIQRLAQSVGPS